MLDEPGFLEATRLPHQFRYAENSTSLPTNANSGLLLNFERIHTLESAGWKTVSVEPLEARRWSTFGPTYLLQPSI